MIVYHSSGLSGPQIRQAAQIQIEELPEGFLSSLGLQALALIFEHAAVSEYGILVVAVQEERVVGYVMGATDVSRFYMDFMRRKTFQALVHFLPRLISISRLKKALETLLYPARRERPQGPSVRAELLDLAVSGPYQGQGVAQELFQRLVREFARRGVGSFQIPTSQGLHRAHRFYEKMGARRIGSLEVHRGEQTYIYQYDIHIDPSSGTDALHPRP